MIEALKHRTRGWMNSLGFDVIRLKNGHQDIAGHLGNVLKSKKIDCVIDVGANTGQYGRLLRTTGYEGYIVSFEPVQHVFSQLEKTSSADDRWFCHQIALGDQDEEKTINVYSSSVFSSFYRANHYSKNIWRSLEDRREEVVSVRRLDGVFDSLISPLEVSKCMLKLDTQGFDMQAFQGAKGCLAGVSVLQSELSMIPIYEGTGGDPYTALRAYQDAGFSVSGLYPINRDESLAVIEFDCVLVRK